LFEHASDTAVFAVEFLPLKGCEEGWDSIPSPSLFSLLMPPSIWFKWWCWSTSGTHFPVSHYWQYRTKTSVFICRDYPFGIIIHLNLYWGFFPI
jgi:hypothetical protein